jgi:farnesyl-diphosphate farnesyltransferase
MDYDLRIHPDSYGREIEEETGRYLDDIHGEVSRTFDAALEKLSGDLSRQIQVGYLMCRIPDTIEDSQQLSGLEKTELLNEYREVLENPDQRKVGEFVRDVMNSIEDVKGSDWDLVKNTHAVTSAFQSFDPEVKKYMKDSVDEMSRGMAKFCGEAYERGEQGIRIRDFEDLEEYCHYVAGTVGEMLTGVFSEHEQMPEQLEENYEDFGQFLQTINIVKDPVEDLEEESAIFIPEQVLEEDQSHDDLARALRNQESGPVTGAVEKLLDRAKRRSEGASSYIENIPEDSQIRGYLEVPFLLAKATMREGREEPEKVMDGELSIEGEEAMEIIRQAGDTEFEELDRIVEERPLNTVEQQK